MFGNKANSNADALTREEGRAYVSDAISALRTEGEQELARLRQQGQALADQLSAQLASAKRDVDQRLAALETLAAQVRQTGAPTEAVQHDRSGLPVRERGESLARASMAASQPTAVDYGAVAFGLATMRGEAEDAGTDLPARYFQGAVQYFADVFAKSDPAFNEAEFKRQAGV